MSDWMNDDRFSSDTPTDDSLNNNGEDVFSEDAASADNGSVTGAVGQTDSVRHDAVSSDTAHADASQGASTGYAQAQNTPPVQPPHRPPYYTGQQPPYGQVPPSSYGTQPQQPRPPFYNPPTQPAKKKSGAYIAVAVLSVVCCLSLLVSGVMAVMLVVDDNSGASDGNANVPSAGVADQEGDREVNENGPTLQITDAEEFDDGGLATSEIVEKNLDATVVLTMYEESTWSYYYGYGYGNESSDSLTQVGGASGIVMSEDGYIITNSHCVYDEDAGAEYARIDVTLYDGRVYEAEIVGYDPTTDLAVIKIDETGLTPAEFGDSSALTLGDRVVTLGNSGGLQWSVSQGVLSGQARDVYEDTGYAIKCLQVDAVINPGSSGGPLLNAYGQVVGVNSAKIVMSGYEGLGFSIPINEAKEVIDDLVKYGYVTGRVSIGITGRSVTSIGYEGFMIENINNDSALKGTNARAGDIITHVNGVRVMSYAEMRAQLTSHSVGDTVTLTLLRLDRQSRETQEFDVQVTLQESR